MAAPWTGPRGEPLFLVCVETEGHPAEPRRPLFDARAPRQARRCLAGDWLLAAPTTTRVVYDSLAAAITDADRRLVCKFDRTAPWHNRLARVEEALE